MCPSFCATAATSSSSSAAAVGVGIVAVEARRLRRLVGVVSERRRRRRNASGGGRRRRRRRHLRVRLVVGVGGTSVRRHVRVAARVHLAGRTVGAVVDALGDVLVIGEARRADAAVAAVRRHSGGHGAAAGHRVLAVRIVVDHQRLPVRSHVLLGGGGGCGGGQLLLFAAQQRGAGRHALIGRRRGSVADVDPQSVAAAVGGVAVRSRVLRSQRVLRHVGRAVGLVALATVVRVEDS